MSEETPLSEKLFGKADPPEGKKYDIVSARTWLGTSGKGFGISWMARGTGFGEIYCEIGPEGQLHIDTECMSDRFLVELFEFLVSKATKDNEEKAWKTVNDYWQEGRAAEKGTENPYGIGGDDSAIFWQRGYDSIHAAAGKDPQGEGE